MESYIFYMGFGALCLVWSVSSISTIHMKTDLERKTSFSQSNPLLKICEAHGFEKEPGRVGIGQQVRDASLLFPSVWMRWVYGDTRPSVMNLLQTIRAVIQCGQGFLLRIRPCTHMTLGRSSHSESTALELSPFNFLCISAVGFSELMLDLTLVCSQG